MEKVSEFVECIRPTCDDDFVDRLHYFWTCLLLAILSSTIFACQVAGNPVQCWMPREYTEAWESYVERNCFMENIYQMQDGNVRKEYRYYPWVPFLLACQSMLFYLPHLVWQQLNTLTGLDMREMVRRMKAGENRRHVALKAADQLFKSIKIQEELKIQAGFVVNLLQCGRSRGVYITAIYLSVKSLFLLNSLSQWLCLNRLFGSGWFHFWGTGMISQGLRKVPREGSQHMLPPHEPAELLQGVSSQDAPLWNSLFPRILYCSLQVKTEQSRRTYQMTLQCVLWINMVNEKVFLCLWWWLLLLSMVTLCNTAYWLIITFVPTCRTAFISRYLRARRLLETGSQGVVKRFLRTTVKLDGIYVLRIISANASDLYATDVVEVLWWRYNYEHFVGRKANLFKEYLF